MVERTSRQSVDGLSIEREDRRRVFVDGVLAEARQARDVEIRRLAAAAGRWLRQRLTRLRATAADRACELPGNRAALAMAAECRSDAALGHFAGETGPSDADRRTRHADPHRIAA